MNMKLKFGGNRELIAFEPCGTQRAQAIDIIRYTIIRKRMKERTANSIRLLEDEGKRVMRNGKSE